MKSSLLYIISGILTALASFANLYLITDYVDTSEFEWYVKAIAIYIFLDPITSLQIPGSITRYFYVRHELKSKDDMFKHVISASLISFLLSILIGSIGVISGLFSAFIGILVFGNMLSRSFYAYFRIKGAAKYFLFQSVTEALVLLSIAFFIGHYEYPWQYFILGQAISYIFSTAMMAIFFTDIISRRLLDWKFYISKKLAVYGASLLPYHYSSISVQNLEKLLLPTGQGWSLFYFIDRFKNFGVFMINKINDLLSPKYVKSSQQGDESGKQKVKGAYMLLFLVSIIAVFFAGYIKDLIFLIFRDDYNSPDVTVYLSYIILAISLRVLFLKYSNDLFLAKTASKLSVINIAVAALFIISMYSSDLNAIFVLNLRLLASFVTVLLMFFFNKSSFNKTSFSIFAFEIAVLISTWILL